MAQSPPDQSFYHPHPHTHPHSHPQLQLPPQYRNPFELLFDERTGAINYNYIRPYIPNQITKPDDLSDSLVMRRPRRTRTTFTSSQIAELEQHFLQGRYLTSSRLAELSAKLALGTAQIKIWFKNRRRRHKIQSDPHKDYCDRMQTSPAAPHSVKTEPNGSANSCGSNSSGSSSSSGGPPSMQTLSLNGSDGSTPNAMTPSPTPTTPTANLMEHYGDTAFNPYYYNNHHASHQPHHHHQSHHAHASYGHSYAPAGTQYYQPSPASGNLQHRQHQQYSATHPHQFQMQQKSQVTSAKGDPDYNFNNPYYMRMPNNLTGDAATATAHSSTAASPSSSNYEPLASKISENSGVRNATGNRYRDSVNDSISTKAKLQLFVTNNTNANANTYNNGVHGIGNMNSGAPAINIMNDCTGAFTKFPKVTSEANDINYQCTMDTLMHAYSNHRNNSTNSQQFATYCFN